MNLTSVLTEMREAGLSKESVDIVDALTEAKMKCPSCGSDKVILDMGSENTRKTYYRCLKCQELFSKDEATGSIKPFTGKALDLLQKFDAILDNFGDMDYASRGRRMVLLQPKLRELMVEALELSREITADTESEKPVWDVKVGDWIKGRGKVIKKSGSDKDGKGITLTYDVGDGKDQKPETFDPQDTIFVESQVADTAVIADEVNAGLAAKIILPMLIPILTLFANELGGTMSKQEIKDWLVKNKAQIEKDASKVMSPEQLKEIGKYESASPVSVEKTKTHGPSFSRGL